MNCLNKLGLCLVLGFTAITPVSADTGPEVAHLQSRWAEIKYNLSGDAQEKAFAELATEAAALSKSQPQSAEAYIWEGIILSTYAGAKGGLGALSLVKQARERFETALKLDSHALAGSANTSLGSLYYQVPGWPIGFGDDDKARAHLQAGLTDNPDGIDSNYFYADFLFDQGEYVAAAAAINKALLAPARLGRELADQGRRKEAQELQDKIRKKLKR
jgi:tetratricopeptide (TPR) repeat protein